MSLATRYFTQITPAARRGNPQPRGTIDKFFEHHVLVILGEPGLGKTTSFVHAADDEPNAKFVRIGEFLSATKLDHWKASTLYLDGLDEHRSRANGVDVIDAINGRLKELGCPKVRISCRTAEWHGGKDLDALSAVSNGNAVVQLNLEPLSAEDIRTLVPDSDAFVKGAEDHGLHEFLQNPQDFLLLYEFYSSRNEWPSNRSELMEGACHALLKEPNTVHSDQSDEWVSDRALARTSDYLASILMLSNVSGIAAKRTSASGEFPCVHELEGDLHAMKAATGRHVFKSTESNRIEPKHRKIAEYMAARFLAARVREGLPLGRVMALLTGFDGGTPPDLRGVYAWLITMLSGMAEHVLVHDPYGAIIYGDAYSWTSGTKKFALDALRKLAKKDPWFRGQDWSRPALGGLSDVALVDDFREILKNDDCKSHLVASVLDIIAGGGELLSLEAPLMKFIRDPKKGDHLRDDAIDAFATACPGKVDELVNLLDDVNAGMVEDQDQYLRGALLRQLYPTVIQPSQVGKYLVEPSGGVIGWYHLFVRYKVFEITSRTGLRDIAEQVQNGECELGKSDDLDDSAFRNRLVQRLIEEFGTEASANEIISWLTIGVGSHSISRMRDDEAKAIQGFFSSNDRKYIEVFIAYFDERWPVEKDWYQVWWRFHELVVRAFPPRSFPRAVLEHMSIQTDQDKRRALFELACVRVMNDEPDNPEVSIDELSTISIEHTDFAGILERASCCEIVEWRQQDAAREKQYLEERQTRQAKNIEVLQPHKDEIEDGKALGYLDHFARVWFDLFTDVDHDATPMERLTKEVGPDLADSIVAGFLKVLEQPQQNSVEDIAETNANGQMFPRGYTVLAALDVLAKSGKDAIFELSEELLQIAIAYFLANLIEGKAVWPSWVLNERPDTYSAVLDTYWRKRLSVNPEGFTDFYGIGDDDPRKEVIVGILPGLLMDFPKAPSKLLELMLLNALELCDREVLLPIVVSALRKRFQPGSGQRGLWLATGFVLDQTRFRRRVDAQVKLDNQEKWAVRAILMNRALKPGSDGAPIASIEYRKSVIEILGSVFNNVHHETGSRGFRASDRDEPSVSDEIRRLIHLFAQDSSEGASHALAELKGDSSLYQWHTDILYASAGQIRTAREAYFTYPRVDQVVTTLSNAEPANATDLKALVTEALREIAKDIRHGNTDGYKMFWNIGAYGKANEQHVDENTARDRLLEHLRPQLRHLDIVAEPEVLYADEKRADIAVYSRGMKLPIEIKQDYHDKIWTAAANQLNKQYMRDPKAEGNGVYLVFWLGGKGMKNPPKGIAKPKSAAELEKALRQTVPGTSDVLIDVVVIDAEVPEDKKAMKKVVKKKAKKKAKKKVVKKKAKKKAKKNTVR